MKTKLENIIEVLGLVEALIQINNLSKDLTPSEYKNVISSAFEEFEKELKNEPKN